MSKSIDTLIYRFDDFVLDVANRQLSNGDARLDLSGRYFDALVLLLQNEGQLIGKDLLFSQVWGDVVVGDAALSQCIKAIRKQLGDDASNPRYIETVPRYGYRFIGTLSTDTLPRTRAGTELGPENGLNTQPELATESLAYLLDGRRLRRAYLQGSAGAFGGGVAGILGGLIYGLALASTPSAPALGTASILLVLGSLAGALGLVGGFGVSFGMAAAELIPGNRARWRIAGAALGGMIMGGLAKLLGIDAFTLLFGQAPAGITGGLEGLVLGGAVALGAHLSGGFEASFMRRPILGGGLGGALAGVLIPVAGGRLLGGSLELLAQSFANTQLQLDDLGRFFGELQFGLTTQVVLGGMEGLLFGVGLVGAVVLARRLWGAQELRD